MKIKKVLLNNIGLKLLALLLAFVTWFYISEANRVGSGETVLQKLLPASYYISKKLGVKPIFVGQVPQGYSFQENEVRVTPESILVIGPSRILSQKEFIYTTPIDLSEHTKSKILDIELGSISPAIKFQKIKAQLYLPIQKLEEEKTKK